ncbi:enoyl-CoA hydratase/isomerase family protein [Halioxenophilus sp. WMMB6]|uniref:enoyl-CoA hydratase/isomerase family protein n=1 Tax=Halioxenophilus sp. WMMB6 TaxID=3073815 RepID=UPI00295E8B28|nr:enoyl-CoA hydratase-related protein [Halioxenophilus sp. WMMB6]
MAEFKDVLVVKPSSSLAIVKLNRPAARNAMTITMARELEVVLNEIASDNACRVVILAGEGAAFCAGLDLKANQQRQLENPGISANIALQEQFSGLITQIRSMPQPVICAMQGAVAGAGLGLALACDVRIATSTLKCLVGAVKIGLSAGECGISYHLPRVIGASRAFEIMLTGRPVLAEEASQIGLVSRVVEPSDLMNCCMELADSMLEVSPYSLQSTKKIMWQNLDSPSIQAAILLENQTQIVGLATSDFAEACSAFLEKRAPKFQGD